MDLLLAPLLARPPLLRADYQAPFMLSLLRGRAPRQATAAATDSGERYTPPWDRPLYAISDGIALLEINGPLYKGLDALTCWCWGLASVDRIQSAITELTARDDVRAVVLAFNSPGGVVTGIPEAAAQIRTLAAAKLTVAFTDTMCCSAAYWLASQCTTIACTLSADIGSIGTYIALYDYTKMLDEWGIKLHLFKRGDLKALGLMGKELTEEEATFLDREVGRTNDRFLAAVKSTRGPLAEDTTQGQWFDGEEALDRRLVDHLVTGLPEVIQSVSESIAQ